MNPQMSESSRQHHEQSPSSVGVAVLTISDTRTPESDKSGRLIKEHLARDGHVIVDYRIVPDEPGSIQGAIAPWIDDESISAVICSGGTGIAERDRTFETLSAMFDRQLLGFGELFRMLSYEEIGPAAMMSRASAGIANATAVFSLPGSSNAVQLAMDKLIGPELGHIVYEIRKDRSSGSELGSL